MSQTKMLGISILFYNKPDLTLRCLENVQHCLHQSKRAGEETPFFLLNNGSSLKSVEAVSLAAGSAKMVHLPENIGFAGGMNAALKALFQNPDVSLAVVMSNDVELSDSFLDICMTLLSFQSNYINEAKIYCPEVYFLMDKKKPAYTHGNLDVATMKLSHHFDVQVGQLSFPNYYPAAASVWTRKAFEKLGGFNEQFFCYWEDVELSYRCTKNEVKLELVPGLRIYHLGKGTTKGKKKYLESFYKGELLVRKLLE